MEFLHCVVIDGDYTLLNAVFTEGAGSIDGEPLIQTHVMKTVTAGQELAVLAPAIVFPTNRTGHVVVVFRTLTRHFVFADGKDWQLGDQMLGGWRAAGHGGVVFQVG